MATVAVTDDTFDAEVRSFGRAGGRGFLGRMVRPLQDDRTGFGRAFGRVWRERQDRQSERGREPEFAGSTWVFAAFPRCSCSRTVKLCRTRPVLLRKPR